MNPGPLQHKPTTAPHHSLVQSCTERTKKVQQGLNGKLLGSQLGTALVSRVEHLSLYQGVRDHL